MSNYHKTFHSLLFLSHFLLFFSLSSPTTFPCQDHIPPLFLPFLPPRLTPRWKKTRVPAWVSRGLGRVTSLTDKFFPSAVAGRLFLSLLAHWPTNSTLINHCAGFLPPAASSSVVLSFVTATNSPSFSIFRWRSFIRWWNFCMQHNRAQVIIVSAVEEITGIFEAKWKRNYLQSLRFLEGGPANQRRRIRPDTSLPAPCTFPSMSTPTLAPPVTAYIAHNLWQHRDAYSAQHVDRKFTKSLAP